MRGQKKATCAQVRLKVVIGGSASSAPTAHHLKPFPRGRAWRAQAGDRLVVFASLRADLRARGDQEGYAVLVDASFQAGASATQDTSDWQAQKGEDYRTQCLVRPSVSALADLFAALRAAAPAWARGVCPCRLHLRPRASLQTGKLAPEAARVPSASLLRTVTGK